MTDVSQIPYKDIVEFLISNEDKLPNKKIPTNKDEVYNLALDLIKNDKAVDHPLSIIKWMMAYNLIINEVNIPTYTIQEINDISQEDISKLSKLLTMKKENRQNIKDILNYLGKLVKEDHSIELLPEIQCEILGVFRDLETNDINNIDIYRLRYDDVINLLESYNNKASFRKFINKNLDKMIVANIYGINFLGHKGILEDIPSYTNFYNKHIMMDIIQDIKQKENSPLINSIASMIIKDVENNDNDKDGEVYIDESAMNYLIVFTFDLLEFDEKGLAKRVFDISNDLRLFGRIDSYNHQLVDQVIDDTSTKLETIINFMGEDEFVDKFYEVLQVGHYFKKFIENLMEIKEYDLIGKILKGLISEPDIIDYFPDIKDKIDETMKLRNNNLIMKYIDVYYLGEKQNGKFDKAFLSKIGKMLNL